MKKLLFIILFMLPLLAWGGKKSKTRSVEIQTQDFVTDSIYGMSCLNYFNCDMFVDRMAFKIISKEERTVELTNLFLHEIYDDCWIYKMDTMRIPETVTWHDTVYTVKAIGPWAFKYSEIKHMEIPSTVTEIKNNAFTQIRELEELVIPSSVTTIGDYAFAATLMLERSDCPRRIVLPETISSIGMGLFYGREGDYIPLPGNPTVIPASTYGHCDLSEWPNLSDDIEEIGEGAFLSNDFKSIRLPEHLKIIGPYAFYNCRQVRQVTIPASVEYIGDYAFGGEQYGLTPCDLDTLRLLSEIPPICDITWETFQFKMTNTVIVVPNGSKELYQTAWKLSFTPVYEESEVTAIKDTKTDGIIEKAYYSLYGRRLTSPQKGINIIRRSDGMTKKMIVK